MQEPEVSTRRSVRSRRVIPVLDHRLRRRLGRAVYLLVLLCDWSDTEGSVRAGDSISAVELAGRLGIGVRQARRDLQRLRHLGLVELGNTGRGFTIRLTDRGRP